MPVLGTIQMSALFDENTLKTNPETYSGEKLILPHSGIHKVHAFADADIMPEVIHTSPGINNL